MGQIILPPNFYGNVDDPIIIMFDGHSGAGKSTFAKHFAEMVGGFHIDADELIYETIFGNKKLSKCIYGIEPNIQDLTCREFHFRNFKNTPDNILGLIEETRKNVETRIMSYIDAKLDSLRAEQQNGVLIPTRPIFVLGKCTSNMFNRLRGLGAKVVMLDPSNEKHHIHLLNRFNQRGQELNPDIPFMRQEALSRVIGDAKFDFQSRNLYDSTSIKKCFEQIAATL